MYRLLVIPAVLILLLCGTMLWSRGTTRQKADFTFITTAEIHTLDTDRMSWMQDFRVAYGLWEGLYRLDPKTLAARPGTADPIDVSPDKTVYTFHIRPDAKWSNGDPVLAKDFVFAWRRLLEEPGEYTYLFHYIVGAQEYEEAFGKAATAFNDDHDPSHAKDHFADVDFAKVGVKALDPLTLQVTLKHPVVPFPDICSMPPFFAMNEKAMRPFLYPIPWENSHHHIRRYDKEFTRAPNLVSNGPYKLESWAYKRRMRLVANPFYYDHEHVVSQVIDQVVAEDEQWAYGLYESGGADWTPDLSGEIAAELFAKHRDDVHIFPVFGTYFYSFNCQPKFNNGTPNPFFDKRVRQALSMAIDKRVIVDNVTRMGQIPTTTYIPAHSFASYKTPKGLPYDIPAAKKLLAEAGYPNGAGFPSLHLLFNELPPHPAVGASICRQWHENLGINIELEGIEDKTFGDRQRNHDYAISRASWYGDYLDPSTFTDKYKPDSENNEAGWVNAEYAALCNKGDVEPDPQKRFDYYAQAETLLLDEAPILPIYTYVECYLMRKDVYGIPQDVRAMSILSSAGVRH